MVPEVLRTVVGNSVRVPTIPEAPRLAAAMGSTVVPPRIYASDTVSIGAFVDVPNPGVSEG